MRLIQLAAPKLGARLFRNNVGQAVAGRVTWISRPLTITLGPGDAIVRGARVLHAGLSVGSSDLIGWDQRGTFLAVEVKTATGVASAEQKTFLQIVNESNARGLLVRSVDEFKKLLSE